MAKKIIRHLEFYGYPDQSMFTGGMAGVPVDLDDIRKKNDEQDKELEDLDDEKVDKSDFSALSGMVEYFLSAQTVINDSFDRRISNCESAITSIHDWIEEFPEDFSGCTDVDERLDSLESGMTEIEIEISGITCALDNKADKDYVDDNFAKKDEVYTMDEIDEMLKDASGCCESCVTESWLEENGYLTKDVADEIYATKEELSGISASVITINEDLSDAVDELSGKVETLSSFTTSKVSTIETNLSALDISTNTRINVLSGTVGTFDSRITDNATNISILNSKLDTKADKSDLQDLKDRVEDDEEEIAKKVDKSTFSAFTITVNDKFDYYDNKKADKSQISALTQDLSGVIQMIEDEKQERKDADELLSGATNAVNERVNVIAEANVTRDSRLDALESGLTKEIADRTQADIDLIGTPNDSSTDDTIWGAKKYAVSQRNQAITEANNYTNQQIANLRSDVNNSISELEAELSEKADTEYVDSIKNEIKTDLRNEINSKVNEEKTRAQYEEAILRSEIAENRRDIAENDEAVSNLADRVNAITQWEGTNPDEYDNSGNGVLDVLHREFHAFEETHGLIKEIKVVDDNLVIVYFTEDGEAESVIPIGQLVNLEDYYTKEETERLINEAISGITLDNYYTKEETDSAITSAVTEVNEKVEENKSAIQVLYDMLGYTDNDTLVTTNENEVAFGKYNVSNTDSDPSGKTAFSIGMGTSDDDRKNSVEIKENGDLYLWVEGDFMCVNKLLGQLAHETYYDDGTYGG